MGLGHTRWGKGQTPVAPGSYPRPFPPRSLLPFLRTQSSIFSHAGTDGKRGANPPYYRDLQAPSGRPLSNPRDSLKTCILFQNLLPHFPGGA